MSTTLKRAHQELFRRQADEIFPSLSALSEHCQTEKRNSDDHWELPQAIIPGAMSDSLKLGVGGEDFMMNDWSFGQLCHLARVKKETVNRLSPDTAKRVFFETLPTGSKPLQVYTNQNRVRSIHAASYTRLHNADLLEVVEQHATDFRPPQKAGAGSGGTGLYCGEQDMFAFLIDPTGWAEINGEAFAPGFFVWNSEVGRRSVGIETFWFQAVCANHIVWDATEVVQFSRKHTTNVHEALGEITQAIESLVKARDARRDSFVKVIRQAMETRLGHDADEATKELLKHGIPKSLATKALELAQLQGGFTIFAVVDALTRLSGQVQFAGDRVHADAKAAHLLALAA